MRPPKRRRGLNSRFEPTEMKAQIAIGQVFVDCCIERALEHRLPPEPSATARYRATDLQCKFIVECLQLDECLRLHGGYGYIMGSPIAHSFIESRASRICRGTNEVMKEIIGRPL